MSDFLRDFVRPTTLAFLALAILGWLVAVFFWLEVGDVRQRLTDDVKRAEVARQSVVADLEQLQKDAGTTSELKRQADEASRALADAVAARAAAQNDLAEFTRQIDEAKLAVSGVQTETSAKARELEAVEAQLKDEQGRLANTSANSNQAREAEAALAAARGQLADLQRQIEEAAKALEAEKAQQKAGTGE